ncbi:MAG: hypothetical protein Q8N09_10700 [Thermodesulfovibrionia bacterium]|nr:hypothetical protein [Thermodesulfovibrionia bacterium]
MEKFKALDQIYQADARSLYFSIVDRETGEYRPLELKDIYETVASVELSPSVPEDVRSQFNVAKNLAVYTWFSYSFHQISELKAFSTLEMALKLKFGKGKNSFKDLIKKSIASGLIKDKGFSLITETLEDEDSMEYSKALPDVIPYLRNELAHGSTMLHPGSITNLAICADFINQLFQNESNNKI